MRLITLPFDHTRTEKGTRVTHKKGSQIVVTVAEYDQITTAVRMSRERLRELARKTPGSPEWRKEQLK